MANERHRDASSINFFEKKGKNLRRFNLLSNGV